MGTPLFLCVKIKKSYGVLILDRNDRKRSVSISSSVNSAPARPAAGSRRELKGIGG